MSSYYLCIRRLGTIPYNNECFDSAVVYFKVTCFESLVPTTFNISGFKVCTNIVNDFYDYVLSLWSSCSTFFIHTVILEPTVMFLALFA